MYANVIVIDHIGFGFSDKPAENFTYSIFNHADNLLYIWKKLEIKSGHLVSHDMGDSVLTEIISRRQRGFLNNYYNNDFFKSITFTNGGMRVNMIKLQPM